MGLASETARPVFRVELVEDLWVVPRVMSRERLQQLVDGK